MRGLVQFFYGRLLVALAVLLLSPAFFSGQFYAHANEADELIQQLAEPLTSKKKAEKSDAIDQIIQSDSQRKALWLQALVDGDLYVEKSSGTVVIAVKEDKLYAMTSAVDGTELGAVKKRKLRKVSANNALRKSLKSILGMLAIEDTNDDVRLDAVLNLSEDIDRPVIERIRELRLTEENPRIQVAMDNIVYISDLDTGSEEQKIAALNYADGTLDNDLINSVRKFQAEEENPALAAKAQIIVEEAEKSRQFYSRVEQLFFGISLGSVLVVAAIGLAITFGVMGVINMAHGELIMLGAYTTWLIQQLFPNAIHYSLILAVPAAFLVSALVGILIERTVIRHLYGRPLETLLATFGISLILQQFVRTVVSPQNVAVINPFWMSGSWMVNPALSLSLNRLVIIFFCLAVFAGLLIIFTRTQYGLQMRAVSQNRNMARAMGIRSGRVDAMSFGLGSGVAGIAGVALSQLGNVGPNLGQNYIIDSFMVVVFGGVGNLWGTLVAGMSLGVANKFLEPWAGAVLAKVVVLVCIILFIQTRPKGLFPPRGRSVED